MIPEEILANGPLAHGLHERRIPLDDAPAPLERHDRNRLSQRSRRLLTTTTAHPKPARHFRGDALAPKHHDDIDAELGRNMREVVVPGLIVIGAGHHAWRIDEDTASPDIGVPLLLGEPRRSSRSEGAAHAPVQAGVGVGGREAVVVGEGQLDGDGARAAHRCAAGDAPVVRQVRDGGQHGGAQRSREGEHPLPRVRVHGDGLPPHARGPARERAHERALARAGGAHYHYAGAHCCRCCCLSCFLRCCGRGSHALELEVQVQVTDERSLVGSIGRGYVGIVWIAVGIAAVPIRGGGGIGGGGGSGGGGGLEDAAVPGVDLGLGGGEGVGGAGG